MEKSGIYWLDNIIVRTEIHKLILQKKKINKAKVLVLFLIFTCFISGMFFFSVLNFPPFIFTNLLNMFYAMKLMF